MCSRIGRLKFVWDNKRSQTTKAILRKNKLGGVMLLDFKLFNKGIVNQNGIVLDRCMYQWNRIKTQGISPYIYDQLKFNKDAKKIQ